MRGRLRGRSLDVYSISNNLKMYTYGIKLLENAYLTNNQFQAISRFLRKFARKILKKSQSVSTYLRSHIFLSRSKKKKGMRMGGAKGPFSKLVCIGRAGDVIIEARELNCFFPLHFLKIAAKKLPAKTSIIKYTFRGL